MGREMARVSVVRWNTCVGRVGSVIARQEVDMCVVRAWERSVRGRQVGVISEDGEERVKGQAGREER